jgi:hypothetical protein
MLHNIPFELQQLRQWVCAGPNKLPLNPRTGQAADVTDPDTWGTFEEARKTGYKHIGFVLKRNGPYSIIDLDEPLNEVQIERHSKIAKAFESYSEVSQSGKGVHIIVKGSIPQGVRRDKVEVYSDSRYMICTGNVLNQLPITEQQSLLDSLFEEMNKSVKAELVQVNGSLTDEQIYNMAGSAANSGNFLMLWAGNWQGKYESQSEADFALLSMLCFYTQDNEQVRRIFRFSELGKRDKATKNDKYLDRALQKIRGAEMPLVDFSALLKTQPKYNEHRFENKSQNGLQDTTETIAGNSSGGKNGAETGEELSIDSGKAEETIEPPTGFVGELARYIFESAIRPVPEIALATAIALTAGVVGRSYNISGLGLNQYLVILAKTGSGKEGAATGIDALISAVRNQVPMVDQFVGPAAFASGQALVRVLDKQPCFVSVLGEFGLTLKDICDEKASSAHVMLKKALLDLYAKSGHSKILRSSVYSESDKNTKIVQAPNVTILGESTPESFYQGVNSSAISAGLLPRFSIFEYNGPRPARNPNPFQPPSEALVNRFIEFLMVSLATQQNNTFCPVQINADAKIVLDDFDTHVDREMRQANQDVILQLWNRAHLKALKLAALIAVGNNAHQPIIDRECALWSIKVVTRDITKLLAKFVAGEIGSGDLRMESDVRRAIIDYLELSHSERKRYQVPESIANEAIVPFGFLRRRLRGLASFTSDRRGANAALASILNSLCEAGEIVKLHPAQTIAPFGINTPLYILGSNWRNI